MPESRDVLKKSNWYKYIKGAQGPIKRASEGQSKKNLSGIINKVILNYKLNPKLVSTSPF